MRLKDLLTVDALSDARFDTIEVGGITADSRTVKPGDLFVAIAGSKDNGLRFVAPAVAAGAAAVMAERVAQAPLPSHVAFVRVSDARRAAYSAECGSASRSGRRTGAARPCGNGIETTISRWQRRRVRN